MEALKPIGQILTQATLELYFAVAARFLPTPAKIHYLFNLRDISKVHKNTYTRHELEIHMPQPLYIYSTYDMLTQTCLGSRSDFIRPTALVVRCIIYGPGLTRTNTLMLASRP